MTARARDRHRGQHQPSLPVHVMGKPAARTGIHALERHEFGGPGNDHGLRDATPVALLRDPERIVAR